MKVKHELFEWVTNNAENHYNLSKRFFQGDPKPTDAYTVIQLKRMGLVGYYKICVPRAILNESEKLPEELFEI